MSSTYVSHARSSEELQAEVCSDLRRRIERLSGYSNTVSRNAAEKARIATAIREFEEMLGFWSNLQIIRRPRRRNFNNLPPTTGEASTE
jgi:predicted lipoprotein